MPQALRWPDFRTEPSSEIEEKIIAAHRLLNSQPVVIGGLGMMVIQALWPEMTQSEAMAVLLGLNELARTAPEEPPKDGSNRRFIRGDDG